MLSGIGKRGNDLNEVFIVIIDDGIKIKVCVTFDVTLIYSSDRSNYIHSISILFDSIMMSLDRVMTVSIIG